LVAEIGETNEAYARAIRASRTYLTIPKIRLAAPAHQPRPEGGVRTRRNSS
jgi:hypothetical protein